MIISIDSTRDADHFLDLSLSNKKVWDGVDVIKNENRQHPGSPHWIVQSPIDEAVARLWINIQAILASMPAQFIVITGVTPQWALCQAMVLASKLFNDVFLYNGKEYIKLCQHVPETRVLMSIFQSNEPAPRLAIPA